MFAMRTDLALESRDITAKAKKSEEIEGVIYENIRKSDGVTVTRIEITNESGSRSIGKPVGKYTTLQCEKLRSGTYVTSQIIDFIAEELSLVLELSDSDSVLVVGLGNSGATPDALGPEVVRDIIVTRHILCRNILEDEWRSVCAISPGVMGQTGMETSDIIKGICEKVKPDRVIVIDALASMSLWRLGTTVQISSTGISPGSGAGNPRAGINTESLGVPVASVGVPTIVDAGTIMFELLRTSRKNIDITDEEAEKLVKMELEPFGGELMVTPKDIDWLVSSMAHAVSRALNLVLHKNLTLDQIPAILEG